MTFKITLANFRHICGRQSHTTQMLVTALQGCGKRDTHLHPNEYISASQMYTSRSTCLLNRTQLYLYRTEVIASPTIKANTLLQAVYIELKLCVTDRHFETTHSIFQQLRNAHPCVRKSGNLQRSSNFPAVRGEVKSSQLARSAQCSCSAYSA